MSTLVEEARRAFPNASIIDPAGIDVPGWRQTDYYRVCAEIISQHASIAVFSNGWELSRGCHVEIVAALTRRLRVLDAGLQAIPIQRIREAFVDAVDEFRAVGIDSTLTRSCLDSLDVL